MSLGVKIPRKSAEKVRMQLLHDGILDVKRTPQRDDEYVYFPVTKKTGKLEFVNRKFGGKEKFETPKVPFDVIGDIAIVEIPDEMKEKEVAKQLLLANPHLKVVLEKSGAREGKFRLRKMKWLAGERRTVTVHRESGALLKLDVVKAYFSPRLSFERQRIAEQVKAGENVLVMFGGVAPFGVVIAKSQPKADVVSIELNPDAARFAEENGRLNKLKNLKAIEGDVRKIVPKRFAAWADRVLMPLPMGAYEFLDEAFLAAKKGCVVHFYHFAPVGKSVEEAKKIVRAVAERQGRKVRFISHRVVMAYSPQAEQIVVDFVVAQG